MKTNFQIDFSSIKNSSFFMCYDKNGNWVKFKKIDPWNGINYSTGETYKFSPDVQCFVWSRQQELLNEFDRVYGRPKEETRGLNKNMYTENFEGGRRYPNIILFGESYEYHQTWFNGQIIYRYITEKDGWRITEEWEKDPYDL